MKSDPTSGRSVSRSLYSPALACPNAIRSSTTSLTRRDNTHTTATYARALAGSISRYCVTADSCSNAPILTDVSPARRAAPRCTLSRRRSNVVPTHGSTASASASTTIAADGRLAGPTVDTERQQRDRTEHDRRLGVVCHAPARERIRITTPTAYKRDVVIACDRRGKARAWAPVQGVRRDRLSHDRARPTFRTRDAGPQAVAAAGSVPRRLSHRRPATPNCAQHGRSGAAPA